MSILLISEHVNLWPEGEKRVYKYRVNLILPHIITIMKVGRVYKCYKEYSTFKEFKDADAQFMINEISKKHLIFLEIWSEWIKPINMRTGGCDCGAAFTTEPNCHAFWCKLGKL